MKVFRNDKKFDDDGACFGFSFVAFVAGAFICLVFVVLVVPVLLSDSCCCSDFSDPAFSCLSRITRSFRAAFFASRFRSRASAASDSFRRCSSSSFFFCSARNSTSKSLIKGTIFLAASRQSFVVKHGPTTFRRAGCSGLPLRSRYRSLFIFPKVTGRFSSRLLYKSRCLKLVRLQKSSVRNFS